ncbi:hypothetical protein DRO24_00300 [Candidatus Bathyarchaeota archaeon]|nr:MAG: hypothetical protein DRO24_00300 [Candidatus Bathyarchaeota archaeon]
MFSVSRVDVNKETGIGTITVEELDESGNVVNTYSVTFNVNESVEAIKDRIKNLILQDRENKKVNEEYYNKLKVIEEMLNDEIR